MDIDLVRVLSREFNKIGEDIASSVRGELAHKRPWLEAMERAEANEERDRKGVAAASRNAYRVGGAIPASTPDIVSQRNIQIFSVKYNKYGFPAIDGSGYSSRTVTVTTRIPGDIRTMQQSRIAGANTLLGIWDTIATDLALDFRIQHFKNVGRHRLGSRLITKIRWSRRER